MEVTADGTDDDLARVQADPDTDRNALAAPDVFGVAPDRLLYAEGSVAGADGVVLVGQRRAKESHDPVAHHLVDGALVVMHRLDHVLEHGVEQALRLLGVAVGEQLHRTLQVREQDRHLLALALERAL